MRFEAFLACAVASATVSAHGYIQNITIYDDVFAGYNPSLDRNTKPAPGTIFRPLVDGSPVFNVSSIDIQCGGFSAGGFPGSYPAGLTGGPVKAGDKVSLKWSPWQAWPSHAGPVITYFARCANDDCASYEPGTDAVWFKVAEGGREGTSDIWATAPIAKGIEYTYTVPPCLAAGEYLVRHEIIALHTAAMAGIGAQFYPSCHQIQVKGRGRSRGPAKKVAFPGAYEASDPSLHYNYFEPTTYTIPGPKIFQC